MAKTAETDDTDGYDPADAMLEGLTEEQMQEIVDEVGERIVDELRDENQEKFLRDLEGAIINNIPLLGMSATAQEGVRQTVRGVLNERTEEMIQDAGDVVVERLVESHSEKIIEDVIKTTSRKIRED